MIEKSVNDFINLAIQSGGWMILDKVYLKNRLISLIGDWPTEEIEGDEAVKKKTSLELLDDLLNQGKENKKYSNDEEREMLREEIMELLTPPTSVVNALFSQHYDTAEKEATDYYHLLNINNGFINSRVLSKSELLLKESPFILQQKESVTSLENSCQQCFSSEGLGLKRNRIKRMIRMNLKGESWAFFYEPNPLLDEHAIFTPEEHAPITLNRQAHETMLRLLDIYPHYFIAYDPLKNARQDHGYYFGGKGNIPLAKAEESHVFDIPGFVKVQASLLNWPLSVIRLRTSSVKNLLNSIEYLTLRWQQYSYPSLDIMAKDEKGNNHHEILPVFRKEGEDYIAELILVDQSPAFDKTKEYQNSLFDAQSMVDQLGIINLQTDLDISSRLMEIIKENFEKQQIFKRTPEGENAFVRFLDTL